MDPDRHDPMGCGGGDHHSINLPTEGYQNVGKELKMHSNAKVFVQDIVC